MQILFYYHRCSRDLGLYIDCRAVVGSLWVVRSNKLLYNKYSSQELGEKFNHIIIYFVSPYPAYEVSYIYS